MSGGIFDNDPAFALHQAQRAACDRFERGLAGESVGDAGFDWSAIISDAIPAAAQLAEGGIAAHQHQAPHGGGGGVAPQPPGSSPSRTAAVRMLHPLSPSVEKALTHPSPPRREWWKTAALVGGGVAAGALLIAGILALAKSR